MTARELPPLNALRAFEAVARLESVSRAAGELHVTHGAISRQLRSLEEALGQPLFTRQGRGLVLTPTGHQLRDSAVEAFDRLRDDWSSLRRRHSGAPFVLGCSSSVLARWVIPRLERMARDLPQLTLRLAAQEEAFPSSWRELDAVLTLAGTPYPADCRVQVLAPERIGPVISPRHPHYARLAGASIESLLDEPLLHTASRPQAWPDWAQAMQLPVDRLRQGQRFDHLYYLLEAALAGLGIAIAPQPLVADELREGRLLAPWGFVTTTAHWLLVTPQRMDATRSAPLVSWLRQELAGQR
ncbi:LysR family transcriptional regulator [Dyella sp.]|uniref:LysR family transcriptional regulator n=1 Tax=Dyella sp. TaxID=1869338 RepID=UPI002ED32106